MWQGRRTQHGRRDRDTGRGLGVKPHAVWPGHYFGARTRQDTPRRRIPKECMSAHGITPARLFTAIALVLGLTFTMFSFTTVGPTTSGASALVTAAKGNVAADGRAPRGRRCREHGPCRPG